jgi:hypothetical protein
MILIPQTSFTVGFCPPVRRRLPDRIAVVRSGCTALIGPSPAGTIVSAFREEKKEVIKKTKAVTEFVTVLERFFLCMGEDLKNIIFVNDAYKF